MLRLRGEDRFALLAASLSMTGDWKGVNPSDGENILILAGIRGYGGGLASGGRSVRLCLLLVRGLFPHDKPSELRPARFPEDV
jgi:hypothetical protein